jgi:large subunit ribosomal protein L21
MYAIIQSGGKQYRVRKGDFIDVDLLDIEDGAAIDFDEVLFLSEEGEPTVGSPFLPGCVVKAQMVNMIKGPKIVAFKYKRRQNYRRKVGHRQRYSRVQILDIIK